MAIFHLGYNPELHTSSHPLSNATSWQTSTSILLRQAQIEKRLTAQDAGRIEGT